MGRKPISVAVHAGCRQADDVGEIRERGDAGDHRDALGQSRRSCREEGQAPADRDAGKPDPSLQGFGRVAGGGHQLDRRPQRRGCELTSPDARQLGNEDEKARPCQSGTEPTDDRVLASIRCRAVDEHQCGPRRSGPRPQDGRGNLAVSRLLDRRRLPEPLDRLDSGDAKRRRQDGGTACVDSQLPSDHRRHARGKTKNAIVEYWQTTANTTSP